MAYPSPRRLQLRRGNASAISSYLGYAGELVVDTSNWTLYVHDGVTVGGYAATVNTASISGNINSILNGTAVFGNIIPSANAVYSLGNITHQWKSLFVSNSTIYVGGVPLSIDTTGNLTVNGNIIPTIAYVNASVANVTVDLSAYALNANVTAANVGLKGYVDQANTIQSSQLASANLGIIGYIDQANTIQSAQITAANVGIIGYIDQANTIQSAQVGAANLAITAANVGLKGYVDQANTIQSEQLTAANTAWAANASAQQTLIYNLQSSAYSNINVTAYLAAETAKTIVGNVTIEGNLIVNGNVSYISVNNLIIGDNIINLADLNPADSLDLGFAAHRTPFGQPLQHTGLIRDASANQWRLFSNVVPAPGTTVDFTDAIYDDLQLGNITSPTIDSLTLANTIQSQQIAAANVGIIGYIDSQSFYSNVKVETYLQYGNPSNISVAGNVTATYFVGNGALLTGIAASSSYSNVQTAAYLATATINTTGNITAGNLFTSGALYVANITTTGASGNISGANYITANYFVGNGALLTGLSSSYSNVQVATYLPTYDGVVTAGNVAVNGNVTAQYFLGNGALLTGIVGGAGNYGNIDVKAFLETDAGFADGFQRVIEGYYANLILGDTTKLFSFGNSSKSYFGHDGFLGNASINYIRADNADVRIATNNGAYTWVFNNGGNLTFPSNNLVIKSKDDTLGNAAVISSGNFVVILSNGASGGTTSLWAEDYANIGTSNIAAVYANPTVGSKIVRIAVGQNGGPYGPNLWDFGNTGTTRFPGSKILAPAGEPITMQSDQYSQLMWENANLTVAPDTPVNSNFYVAQNSATLDIVYRDGSSNQQQKSWLWNLDGNLKLPSGGYIINSDDSIYGGGNYSNVEVAAYLNTQGYNLYSNANVASYLPLYGGDISARNITVSGNIALTGNVLQINSAIFYGNTITGFSALYAGIPGYTPIPQVVAQFTSDFNGYAQINSQNLNTGNQASSDFIATANNGTDSAYFVDFGIAGSGYDPSVAANNNAIGTALTPNDAYLYTAGNTAANGGGNLVIGVQTLNKNIRFFAGGVNANNVVLTIQGNGISTAGNVTGTYFIGSGQFLTGLPTAYSNVNVKAYTESMGFTNYSNVNVSAYLSTASINTTGNITAQNLIGNISITGNVTGTSANVTLQAGAYTSVFDNQGNVRLPTAYVSGNVTANYFIGNGALLTGIAASSNYSNVNVATYLPTYSGNIANVRLGVAGVLTFADGTTQTTAGGGSYSNVQVAAYLTTGVNTAAPQIQLTNATSNFIKYNNVGVGAPTFTTSNVGTRIIYWSSVDANTADYAVGIDAGTLWHGIPRATSGFAFKWYGGNTQIAMLEGTGSFTIANIRLSPSGNIVFPDGTVQTTAATGTYSNIQVATYLPTYSGNIANIRLGVAGVLTFADGTTQITAGGSSYSNVQVATYLPAYGGAIQSSNVQTTTANIQATTAATNPATGALRVMGGVGVAGTVFAGQLNTTGNLVANTVSVYGINVVANILASAVRAGTINSTGNILAQSIIGTIATASQPSITEIGTLATLSVTGNATVGNLIGTEANTRIIANVYTTTFDIYGNVSFPGNVSATNFVGSGSLLSGVAIKTTGSWTVPTGNSTQSFTVPTSGTYQLWVDCNIPNGILAYNATATVTNSNVPVVGQQFAWVYNGGGTPIDFTSIPNQFVGTGNTIVRSSVSPSVTTNRFDFGINNTSGGNVTVSYGYVKIS